MATSAGTTNIPGGHPAYPVQVRGAQAPSASRWLWVVKWVLVLPHVFVLFFLWLAFFVLSLVALVAIVLTERYPRGIFEFNVGVLRWTWRVAYYSYGVLGTDRYPPFTLEDVPDYPAHFDVAYPEQLSRGLALLKWWLLALPHYVVVSLFAGTGVWWVRQWEDEGKYVWGGGLVGILVLVAAVVLLFTGRYPGSVYDLLLGLHRWVLRVCAYAGLMTDEYPPFRLDLGPDEPGSVQVGNPPPGAAGTTAGASQGGVLQGGVSQAGAAAGPAATTAGTAPAPRGGSGGRVAAAVVGAVGVLASLALLPGGMAMLVVDNAMRDSAGYVTTAERSVSSDGYAVTLRSVKVEASPWERLPGRLLGKVRVTVVPQADDTDLFVGIGRTAEVDRYLDGVARTVHSADGWGTRDVAGAPPTAAPAAGARWVAQASGPGTQQLVWTPRDGDWALVLMNADASAGVYAGARVGAQLPWLGWGGGLALALGAVLMVAGVAGILLATRPRRAAPHSTA